MLKYIFNLYNINLATYKFAQRQRSTYPLNSVMKSTNLQMVKILKYKKAILTNMLNANLDFEASLDSCENCRLPDNQHPVGHGSQFPNTSENSCDKN